MQTRTVVHPQLGPGTLIKTYMGGFEWEVLFESGRRFRLPAREFQRDELNGEQAATASPRFSFAPRIAVLETDQFRARQSLEALRFGIVPVQDAETLTIGLEAERVSLDRALQRSLEHGGDVQAIIGDYGFGKSHFIELAARRALRRNMLVATTSLDLVEVPPSKANEIYRSLVANLRYPDTEEQGLAPLLRKAVAERGVIDQLAAQSPRQGDDPLVEVLKALAECPSQRAFEDIVLWISGQIKPTADLRSCLRKPPRLYSVGEVARQYSYLLTEISILATLLDYGGLAVLIDESEHYSLLRARQRDKADAYFKSLIYAALGPGNSRVNPTTIPDHAKIAYDLTFASKPHLFFLFALTESENRMPVDQWLTPAQIIRLDDRFIERDIAEFFRTLLRYHSLAYGFNYPPPSEHYEAITREVPSLLARALNQHRINLREVIRLAVTAYDLLYLHADYLPDTLLDELASGLRLQRL